MRQDRGHARASGRRQKLGLRVRFRLLPKEGRNGIYLFELEAQPGGPEGAVRYRLRARSPYKRSSGPEVSRPSGFAFWLSMEPNHGFTPVTLRPEPGTVASYQSPGEAPPASLSSYLVQLDRSGHSLRDLALSSTNRHSMP